MSEDALTATRLLADRPTLQRLIRSGNRAQLELFLRRACGTLSITACAVTTGPNVLASTRQGVQWTETLEAVADQGERFLLAPTWQPDGLLGGVASVPNFVETRVIALRYFDDRLAKQLSDQSGMAIRLVRLSNWLDNVPDDYKELHSTALSRTESVARRIEARNVFASSTPIFASTGEGIVLLEARLRTSESDAVVAGFVRRLTWIAFLLALGAVAGALVLARRLGQPLETLADSATRLGRGDFSASIPIAGGGPEVVALAKTLEDMRRNLVELTATLRRREADAQAHAARGRRGRLRRRRQPQRPLPEPAGREDARRRAPRRRSAGSAATCSSRAPTSWACGRARPLARSSPRASAGQAQSTEFLQRADGSKRTVVITSAGPVDGLQVQVMRDETDLEAVRRARDSILANISHEFRTPLAAQLASIELLQENLQEMPREQIEELVTSLRRGSLRLTRLIDNLLESVRIESGQLSIRQQDLHLPEIIHDAVELVGSLFTQRGQTLHVDVPDDLPPIVGDGPRLVQVFVNLLANANKFGPEGSAGARRGTCRGRGTRRDRRRRGHGRARDRARLDLRAVLPLRRPGAGAARARARALDREVDRRASRRPRRRHAHRRTDSRAWSSRCRSRPGHPAHEDPGRRRRSGPARARRIRAVAGGLRRGQGRRRAARRCASSRTRRRTSRSSTSTCPAAAASTSARRSASSRACR